MRFENTRLINPLSPAKIGASSATDTDAVVLLLLESVPPFVNQLGEQRSRRHRRQRKRDARLLYSRDLENVVDQREKIFRFCFRVADRGLLRHRHRAEIAVGEHLQRREHGCERSLEIVHDHLHQIVAHLLQLAKLAQAVLQRVGCCP